MISLQPIARWSEAKDPNCAAGQARGRGGARGDDRPGSAWPDFATPWRRRTNVWRKLKVLGSGQSD
jgi:hypothetical protein